MAREAALHRRLTCGQMARANCVTEKTLRFYQKKGLLVPRDVDEETGFRYYNILQSTKLDMVTHLRSMGLSLDDIQEIDEKKDIQDLKRRARRQLDKIEQQIQELIVSKQLAEALITDCESYENRPLPDHPLLEVLPERHMLTFDMAPFRNAKRSPDLTVSDEWEWELRFVKQAIVAEGLPMSLFRNVGFITTLENVLTSNSYEDRLFVLVDPSFGDIYDEAQVLPGGMHACLYIESGYDAEGGGLDSARFGLLLEFIDQNGMEPCGQPFCEAISRYNRFFNQNFDSFSRYCIPARRKATAADDSGKTSAPAPQLKSRRLA